MAAGVMGTHLLVYFLITAASVQAYKRGASVPFAALGNVVVSIENYGPCPQYHDLPNKLVNVSVWVDPEEYNKMYASGAFIITETFVDGQFENILVLKRCLTEDPNSCEKYLEQATNEPCKHLKEKGRTWSPFVSAMENYDATCPILPGTYKFTDAEVDTELLSKVEVAVGHWQIETRTKHKGIVTYCSVVDAFLKRSRVRPM